MTTSSTPDPNPITGLGETHRLSATTVQATPLPFRTQNPADLQAPVAPLPGAEDVGVQFFLIVEKEQEIQTYPLENVIHTIGRSADNSIRIQDRFLSRHHAYLVRVPLGNSYTYSLFDGDREQSLPSRNGVFVNNQRISSYSLHMDDVIYFGPNVRARLYAMASSRNSESPEGKPVTAELSY